MNVIKKETTGYNAGQWVLYRPNGTAICPLGFEIEVFLRRVVKTQSGDEITYVVEIKSSLIHHGESDIKNALAALKVPAFGPDARICMSVFKGDAFGETHRLGLQKYVVAGNHGYVMTINGLLWDGKILHVKDIAA